MVSPIQHKIRSFVMRAGKLTAGQKRALDELLPQFALDQERQFDQNVAFGNDHPVYVDIGFGNGESLIHIAQMYPHINFIGMEVHAPGVGHLLLNMEKHQINNIRIYQHDGVEVLKHCFADNSLDAAHIYFPDPWHKKRHHKRRLVQKEFLDMMGKRLKNEAYIHVATDWQEYAEHIRETFADAPQYHNIEKNNNYTQRPEWRPVTKFERRGIKLGHDSYDMIYHIHK